MASVLTKIQAVVQEFPKPNLANRLSYSPFRVSPLAHRAEILASHPQISQRLQNINAIASRPSKKRRYMIATALLLGILVCTALILGYSTMQVQKSVFQKENAALANGQSVFLYNESVPFDSTHPTGILFADESSLQLFIASLPQGSSYVGCYVDGNGITHTYTSSIPNIVEVSGQSVIVNGHSSFIGNESYPLDNTTHPTGNAIINEVYFQVP